MNRIPIYTPYLTKYKASAKDAIDSGWISNHGKYVFLAQEKIKEILGVKYCILMNNGTAATHCLYVSLKIKYPNITKIYIPNCVFIAPWNTGMLEYPKKCFEVMKTDLKTLNIDTSEDYILSLEKNSAMIIVHNYGNIINVPRLKKLRPDIIFLEDNCEGLFGKYDGKYSGTESLCSACSFYGNKTITTGEGGAFLTNDEKIYTYMKTFYSHGMTKERYVHDKVAVNYRMTNVQAGFLFDQLNDLEHILSLKKDIVQRYVDAFKNIKQIYLLEKEKDTEFSNWMFVMLIDSNFDSFEKFMNVKDIDVRPIFYDIGKHSHLKDICRHDKDIISLKGVMLPSYPGITKLEQTYIINSVIEFFS